jgi:hypothetical protein
MFKKIYYPNETRPVHSSTAIGIMGDLTYKFERIVNKNNIHVMYKDHNLLTKMLTKSCKKTFLC